MVNKFVIRRNNRIKRQLRSQVNITQPGSSEPSETVEFSIPGGVFIAPGHCWASLEPDGKVNVGIDDFAKKIIGKVDSIDLPNLGMQAKKGQLLFTVEQGIHSIPFNAPITGRVESVNKALLDDLDRLDVNAYGKNYFCIIDGEKLDEELSDLKIGQSAVDYFNDEIAKLYEYVKKSVTETKDENKVPADGHVYIGELEVLKEKDLNAIVQDFFKK